MKTLLRVVSSHVLDSVGAVHEPGAQAGQGLFPGHGLVVLPASGVPACAAGSPLTPLAGLALSAPI